MRKKAAGILKAVWTIVISVALISAGLMCLSLQKQRAETALDMLLLFSMTYLHEQKGWGKQRLENYYDGCTNLLKEFEDGKHTIKSLRDKLVEETKINLVEVQN